ncbi:MAG: phenylacetate--CoA ligase family protein [Actinomycetota bacterium]|nr:phenylacetate--CoA ligase family protein [Actinomycetota bacterium]
MTTSEARRLAYVEAFDDRVAEVVNASVELPAFARRLEQAGIKADRIGSARNLSQLPIQTKDDLLEAQRQDPPFGGMLAEDADVSRIFQSPGPLYEPQIAGPDPWRWAPALKAAGFGPDDTVLNCFGYHLSPAGIMFDEGCRALGARVVPGGIGSGELQARAISDLPISGYTGLPSYLKSLTGHFESLGLDRGRWTIERAVVTAEPLPDTLRRELNEFVPCVLMAYGTAETGLLGFEESPGNGLVVADDVLVEVCDLTTGEPLTEGEGQIVITLFRPEYPLIRFGTGDLSAWIEGPDGRPRLAGILGRIGQAVKVRGMFLHPAQATRTVGATPGVGGFRLVVDRAEHRDSLRCEVVVEPGHPAEPVVAEVRERIRQGLRFTCDVIPVDVLPEGTDVIVDNRDWS